MRVEGVPSVAQKSLPYPKSPKLLLTLKSRCYKTGRYPTHRTPPMNKQELISTLKALDTLNAEQKAYLIDLVPNSQSGYW